MNYGKLPLVAYFCMEYALHPELKTYAGGLGILAGDYLKAAKDMNVSIIGIGIKWKQGYTEQFIGENGEPYDSYNDNVYDFLEDTGIKVRVNIRNHEVVCKAWLSQSFGTNPIYLLDTDVPENNAEDRWITGQLYGWFKEERIAQEIILGIGGIKLLRKLEIPVEVYHFNEGHAALAALELIKEKMESAYSFEEAWRKTREEVVFTTHTPIVEGNETHTLESLEYMGAFNNLSREQIIRIGGNPFNMTVAALRLCRKANAVAKLHGETSNKMWNSIAGKSEIISITNAIHIPTWVDSRITKAYDDEKELLNVHKGIKEELIDFIYNETGVQLKKEKLIIGFSRRATAYKRSDFIFRNLDIMEPLLKTSKVQIVFSGKAHPLDHEGKHIIANLVAMTKKYPNSVVFLENYNMTIGKMLTRGVDLWLNNPRRPLEASGTSGMKAAMNGVLNCSILDGWWPEACIDGVNGWQFGNGFESEDLEQQDQYDLKDFYDVLFKKIIPIYYDNEKKWEKIMRESIRTTREQFSMKRMIEEYFEKMYSK